MIGIVMSEAMSPPLMVCGALDGLPPATSSFLASRSALRSFFVLMKLFSSCTIAFFRLASSAAEMPSVLASRSNSFMSLPQTKTAGH